MAIAEINEFLKIVPAVRLSPHQALWSSCDLIVRYENDEVIGLTVLHASRR